MVSLSHTLASLSDDDVMALVGPAAWANGLRLARGGAVREFSWSEDGEQAEARVKEAGLTYRVRVAQGAVRPSLTCACPLRGDCPHTVAVLIVGRDDARDKQRSVPEWSRVLEQMLGSDRDRLGEPLALVVDAHDPGVEPSLIPLRRSSSSGWTTKRASWLDLTATQWASVTDGLDPTHVSLMREGYRLSRESRSWHSRTEVTLSSLGEHAYAWLSRLVRAGVELYASPKADELVVLSHATWDADIDVRSGSDGLDVRVVARNGDEVITRPRIDRDASVLLLDGGRAIARIEGLGTLDGFPLDRGLHIPVDDVAQFRGTWLPALLRRFSMASSDGSFDAQARPDVSLVGTVRRDGEWVVVRWWAEYCQGESRSRTPVAHCLGDEAVAEIVGRVESWGRGLDSALWSAPPRTGRLSPWRVPAFLDTIVDSEGVDDLVWDVADDVRSIDATGSTSTCVCASAASRSACATHSRRSQAGRTTSRSRERGCASTVNAFDRWRLSWRRRAPWRDGTARESGSRRCRSASSTYSRAHQTTYASPRRGGHGSLRCATVLRIRVCRRCRR